MTRHRLELPPEWRRRRLALGQWLILLAAIAIVAAVIWSVK